MDVLIGRVVIDLDYTLLLFYSSLLREGIFAFKTNLSTIFFLLSNEIVGLHERLRTLLLLHLLRLCVEELVGKIESLIS